MKLVRYLGVALESIMAYKLRAILTLLGFVIGVAAVTSMFGLGRGLSSDIMTDINNSGGLDILELQSTGASFTNADVLALANTSFNPALGTVLPIYQKEANLVTAGKKLSNSVLGTTNHYLAVKNLNLAAGRFISADDITQRASVAVLGATVAQELFAGQSPLGQTLVFKHETVLVVGVLEEKGGFDYYGPDAQVIVPLSTAQEVLFNATRYNGSREVSIIVVQAADADQLERAKVQIEVTLRLHHNLKASAHNDFYIQSQQDFIEMAENISNTLTIFLGSIGSISLLVAGIGIMNIMLVSVTERTHEIGLRKAIGAHQTDILLQFLIEALVFCLLGGAAGLGLTYGVKELVEPLSTPEFPLKILVQTEEILLALGISLSCGLIFGIYPAIRASKLSPIEALRYE
ncbi:MAG: ABC transporter permease [Anaerolineae bacterium]